jgi:transcriptional regulator with XRE-family HTH domain
MRPYRDHWRRMCAQLVEARLAANKTQAAIARQIKVGKTNVSETETGRTVPNVESVIGYADTVGMSLTLVPMQLSRLLSLDPGDVVMILRAAQVAAELGPLDALEAQRVRAALAKAHVGEAAK